MTHMLDHEPQQAPEHVTTHAPVPPDLQHDLQTHLSALNRFDSLESVEGSPVYRALKKQIDEVLNCVVSENFRAELYAKNEDPKSSIRVVAWNIERGKKLDGIIYALREHETLRRADILLLTELDCGMARTHNRYVAGEIARALTLNYVFAPSYLSLNKGSGLEAEASGDNTHAVHGNALFSCHPITHAHAIRLPNGKDKMRGREKRLGSQRAVIADIRHPSAGHVRAVSVHLDAHSSQKHRAAQMRIVIDHLARLPIQLPIVIGGDWNTSTYNSRRAVFAIAGFFRRVMMGVGNVLKNHYPYPDRWFERHLFRTLEQNGYDYRSLNQTGAGTLHYDVNDVAQYQNMAEWVPRWCFWFIKRALERAGGRCSLKLDWFAGKGITPAGDGAAQVIGNLHDASGGLLSDHDPIALDFRCRQNESVNGGAEVTGDKENLHTAIQSGDYRRISTKGSKNQNTQRKFNHMKKLLMVLCLALATATVASAQMDNKMSGGKMRKNPKVGGAAMMSNMDIVSNAVNSPIHKTLVAAVKAAGLVDTLKGAGPFTVFAPADSAFQKLPAGTVDTLVMPENKEMLTKILTYHVVPGALDSKAIAKQIKAGKGSAKLTTAAGGTLTATMEGKTLVLTDEKGGKSRVQIANVYQSNGVIHSVDTVLMPN